MMLTVENAHEYEGKYLDSTRHLFHYYPLFIMNHKTLGWAFADKNHVVQKIPECGMYFENVIEGNVIPQFVSVDFIKPVGCTTCPCYRDETEYYDGYEVIKNHGKCNILKKEVLFPDKTTRLNDCPTYALSQMPIKKDFQEIREGAGT